MEIMAHIERFQFNNELSVTWKSILAEYITFLNKLCFLDNFNHRIVDYYEISHTMYF